MAAPPHAARDPQGYAVQGVPVAGGTTIPQAPTLGPGTYTDELKTGAADESDYDGGSTLYYGVRLGDGDRLHFVATAPVLADSTDAAQGLDVTLVTTSGDPCSLRDSGSNSQDVAALVVGVHSEPFETGGEACAAPGAYIVSVHRSGPRAGTETLSVELVVRVEPPSSGSELPAYPEAQPEVAPRVGGAATATVGGRGFGSAPLLAPGSYTDTIVAGETRFYAFAVDWGQTPAFLVQLEQELPSGQYLRAVLRNPLREEVPVLGRSLGSDVLSGSGAAPVRRTNRVDGDYQTGTLYVDGVHYLVLSVDAEAGDTGEEHPLSLQVDAVGAPEDPPAYGLREPALASSAETGTGDVAMSPEPDSAFARWVWPGAAALLVVLALGLLLTARRRDPALGSASGRP